MPAGWRHGCAAACLAALVLTGCADRLATAEGLAGPAGLAREVIATRTFHLTAFTRIRNPAAPVVVYIEGDGLAWVSRGEPSLDPTPRDPLGLRLAALDPSANVVYLARPCQYTKGDPRCAVSFWTDRRLSEDVVVAMDEAVNAVMRRAPRQPVHLVGYSGGGAIAALLAARRTDVGSLRTVAGNLDHDAVNRLHAVSAMSGSLNPISVAPRLSGLPQEHFVGEGDRVVPPSIAERFVKAQGQARCATITIVAGATHGEGWEVAWRNSVARVPTCSQR